MKTRTRLQLLLMSVLIAQASLAGAEQVQIVGKNPYYWTAADLQHNLELANRSSLSPSEEEQAHAGMAYVMGVADAIQGHAACPVRGAGVLITVGKYLATHKDKWNLPAATVVRDALAQRFPCKAGSS